MNHLRVLGISFDVYITSACLIEDGKILAACPEERLSRVKLTKEFPRRAIRYCLEQADCNLAEVDYIAVGWNPGVHANHLNPRFSSVTRWRAEQLYAIPNFLLSMQGDQRVHQVTQHFITQNAEARVVYVDHHRSHAALYFLSPFQRAAVMTCDGMGEENTVTLSLAEGNKITELQRQLAPHSLGHFYGAVTQFLGFARDCDEWKVMALGAFNSGRPNPYYEGLRRLIEFRPGGSFELNLNYFTHYMHDFGRWYSDRFVEEFGPPRKKDEPFEERHYQIADALQLVTEEALAYVLNHLHERTGERRLVVSGGTFMNSVFNGKITALTPFKEVFIPPCPDDSGVSIGAALHVYHEMAGGENRDVMQHNFHGPAFSDEEIKQTLERYKIRHRRVEDVSAYAAGLIAQGKIIGWFQGRMEFGQRALGNRSILADPRQAEMKDRLNASVKNRESFRPFAPAILRSRVEEFFEVVGTPDVPFMERVYMVRPEKRSLIPAAIHVDGSGRLQTVEEKGSPRFFRLIAEFDRITGVPVVVNTSFNLNGEPIVCTPTDAIRTFYSSGLDALALGDFVIDK